MGLIARALLGLLLAAVCGCGGAAQAPGRLPRPLRPEPSARRAAPSGPLLLLRYVLHNHDGRWDVDVALGEGLYAERRTHAEHGHGYAFGDSGGRSWLRVGDGPARVAEAPWRREARTRSAIFGLRFLRREPAEEAFCMRAGDGRHECVYRPRGGSTLTLQVDRASSRVLAWDHLDAFGRLGVCDGVTWTRRADRELVASAACATIDGEGDHAIASYLELADAREVPALPAWALGPSPQARPRCADRSMTVGMPDELRAQIDVRGASGEAVPFVLDSGADQIYVSAEVAEALGVVPTGDVPIYEEPPWLPSGSGWIGVADRLSLAGMHLDGVRVVVREGLGVGGLLGAQFFRRFVVEIDAPARAVRLTPHERYRPPPDATAFYARGMSREVRIRGEIVGIDEGTLVLDSGAPVGVVVTSPGLSAARPRRPGSSVVLHLGDGVRGPDYETDIDGLRLGPFAFPSMPAWGRDRERERVGPGIGLIGMGTMRHLHLAFDFRNRIVYASAADGFQALARAGLVLDDDEGSLGGAHVTRVTPESAAWHAGVRAGDVLLRVDGVAVRGALDARAALAVHAGGSARLGFARRGRPRDVTVALAGPATTVDPLRAPAPAPEVPPEGAACGRVETARAEMAPGLVR